MSDTTWIYLLLCLASRLQFHLLTSVFRFQLLVLKAGLVDLWKWRVWVKQKEEALLKVILKKKQFILELHNFGGNSGLLGKRLKETEKSNRAPTLRLTSLTQLHRSLLTTFRSKSKCLFFFQEAGISY